MAQPTKSVQALLAPRKCVVDWCTMFPGLQSWLATSPVESVLVLPIATERGIVQLLLLKPRMASRTTTMSHFLLSLHTLVPIRQLLLRISILLLKGIMSGICHY